MTLRGEYRHWGPDPIRHPENDIPDEGVNRTLLVRLGCTGRQGGAWGADHQRRSRTRDGGPG
ncbi:hypothetical protein J2Z30_004099 [Streptomyces iranensis]|uniref:Uncharacterized protein n=1 Tax=Streptomyces iranensis TaxID=576784 RepID=A0ABS4MTM5_9ACTN|nr:hypothetical protein [Streptomyces iranensis]